MAWRPSAGAGDDRAEDLALTLLRAITRPAVRDEGLPGALRALVEATDASACVVRVDEPLRLLSWSAGELAELDEEPAHSGREAEVVLGHGGGAIGRLRLLGLDRVATVQEALAYLAGDLGWVVAHHVDRGADQLAALKAEVDRLREVTRSLPDGVALVASTGRVVAWNRAMEELTGIAADDALLQPWRGLVDLRDDAGAPLGAPLIGYTSARQGEAVDWLEVATVHRAGGEPVVVEFGFAPTAPGPAGHGVAMAARDVTLRHRARRTRERFLARASDELRTPLTPLRGLLELFDRGVDELPPASREQVREAAERQIDRLSRLADDLVTMVDLDHHLAPDRAEEVDLRSLLRDLVGGLPEEATRRIEVDVPQPVGLRTQPAVLRRIVLALVDNAVEHARGPIAVRVTANDDEVVIEVDDAGTGIAPERRAALLRPLDASTTPADEPTAGESPGLGLRVASTLAIRLGGRLALQEGPTGGLRAELRLMRHRS